MEPQFQWKILNHYFDSNRYFVSKHHLDSYNDFIEHMVPKVISSMNPIEIRKHYVTDDARKKEKEKKEKHIIQVFVGGESGKELFFDKPMIYNKTKAQILFPNEARLKDHTYETGLYANITIKYHSPNNVVHEQILEHVKIGAVPIMTHSKLCVLNDQPAAVLREMGECQYDQGGYFIVNGKEKVIISQERNITNQLFFNRLVDDSKFSHKGFIRCTAEKTSVFPKTINFMVYNGTFAKGAKKNTIVVQIPSIKTDIPLFILFRALGLESDKAILSTILPEFESEEAALMMDFLRYSIVDGNLFYTQKLALEYLQPFTHYKTVEHVLYALHRNFLTNLDDFSMFEDKPVEFPTKALYLGHVVNHLVKVCIGIKKDTDRDNYMFKRLAISGFLMGDIFKDFYNLFRNKLRNNFDKMYESNSWNKVEVLQNMINDFNMYKLFDSNIIQGGLVRSLKGQWGIERSQTGIVQDLSRVSYMSFISHMRRVSSPMDPSIKIRSPHQLNTSQFGIMCPCESPDGASIGLIKNFAMMAHVTFYVPSESIIAAMKPFRSSIMWLSELSVKVPQGMTHIMLNNTWIAMIETQKAPVLVEYIRLLRRNALINIFTSVSWNIVSSSINILTESGRCCRPLFIVEDHTHFTLERKPALLKKLNKLENWYMLAKGDTLKEDEFNMYHTHFTDPFKLFGMTKLKDVMDKLQQNSSVIEFIDVEECNVSMIAMTADDVIIENKSKLARYTHCELHPSVMFSVYTATIPLANHNHAPRNIFSGAQGKQAIGIYATNFNDRIDTMSYVLHYPQQRLVKTRYADLLNISQMPNGENLIVAICTYTGYNQEDSIIFNRDSVDRGMFNITYYKSFISEELDDDPSSPVRIIFANPSEVENQGKKIEIKAHADYSKLDEHGYPKLNAYIREKDAIVGKCRIHRQYMHNAENIFEDDDYTETYTSVCDIADRTIQGHVDKVFAYTRPDGKRVVKVKLRKVRTPEFGDKSASAHGQKGVCGMILPRESMPFTKDGLVPDIIINPHALPTRMTVGHWLECLMTKLCMIDGTTMDATPFDENNMDDYSGELLARGFHPYGDEILYNGFTGEQIHTDIFFGPTYYHRLKHMVADKINYRTQGKKVGLTMQPTKGRSNEGGLRIGEMEANCLISHGLAGFAKESFMERSDKHAFVVDDANGEFVTLDPKKGVYNGVTEYSNVHLPYAFKLLSQELMTMNIMPRLVTSQSTMGVIDDTTDDWMVAEDANFSDDE